MGRLAGGVVVVDVIVLQETVEFAAVWCTGFCLHYTLGFVSVCRCLIIGEEDQEKKKKKLNSPTKLPRWIIPELHLLLHTQIHRLAYHAKDLVDFINH